MKRQCTVMLADSNITLYVLEPEVSTGDRLVHMARSTDTVDIW